MKHIHTYERGIGVIAVIAIIAIIGIGGVAAVQVYNSTQGGVAIDEKEKMQETEARVATAKADARSVLESIQADLDARISTNVAATLDMIAETRANLSEAYADADVELRVELKDLNNALIQLETEVRSGSQAAEDTLDEILVELSSNTETSVESGSDVDTSVDINDTSADTNNEGNVSVDADAGVDVDTDASVEDVDMEADMSVQSEAELNL